MNNDSNAIAVSRMGTKHEYQEFHVYDGSLESNYVDGYIPVSYEAPHSSLIRTSTWVGMGLVLTSLAGFGILIFGMASSTVGSQENWDMYAMIGAIIAAFLLIGGAAMIHSGRSSLRAWRARTGRND